MAPAISVIMPVYNGERYLRTAIDSVLGQSWSDFEFLILDDGSTDSTSSILQEYVHRDERVKILSGARLGIASALNLLIEHAEADYVARMDADDISLPDRLAKQVSYMRLHHECVAVGCQARFIDPDGLHMTEWSRPQRHHEIMAMLNRGLTAISHPTAMIRRQALTDVGGYDSSFEFAQDLDLWLRLGEQGSLANLPDELFHYRLHNKQVGFAEFERQTACARRAVEQAFSRNGKPTSDIQFETKPRPSRGDHYRMWAQLCLLGGEFATARKYASMSVREKPTSPRCWLIYASAFVLGVLHPILPNWTVSVLRWSLSMVRGFIKRLRVFPRRLSAR